jgi:hypothetical protein
MMRPTRRPEEFEILKSFAEKQRDELQEAASTALAAPAVLRHDPGVRERVAAAIAGKCDADFRSPFERRFGGDQVSVDWGRQAAGKAGRR